MESRNIPLKEMLATVLMCTCFDFSVIAMNKGILIDGVASRNGQEQWNYTEYKGGPHRLYVIRNNEDAEKLVDGCPFEAIQVCGEVTVPLDLSKCKNLEELTINSNINGSIDLSNCNTLARLTIHGNISGSITLPEALYSLDIYDKLSGTIIFPASEGQLMDVFIGSDAEITNKLDLSNCNNLRKITILGKLRGGIVPSGKFEKVTVSSNAEITGGLDLSRCTWLSEVQTKKGLENLLTLPRQSPFLIHRTLN